MNLVYSEEEKRLGMIIFSDEEERQFGVAWSHAQDDWSLCGMDECVPVSDQLVAAAPDLLAALEKCVLALRFHDWNASLAARRAIAKAKGEEFDPKPQIKYRE